MILSALPSWLSECVGTTLQVTYFSYLLIACVSINLIVDSMVWNVISIITIFWEIFLCVCTIFIMTMVCYSIFKLTYRMSLWRNNYLPIIIGQILKNIPHSRSKCWFGFPYTSVLNTTYRIRFRDPRLEAIFSETITNRYCVLDVPQTDIVFTHQT